MSTVTLATVYDLRDFLSGSDSPSNTTIHITDQLYAEVNRTYIAFGKCNVQKVGGGVAALAAVAGLLTGGLALVVAAPMFIGGSAAAVMALKEFRASPYADEVFALSQRGFKLIRNSNNVIVLG
jgi:hypothetical protein